MSKTPQAASAHADRQKKYYSGKMDTHQRLCIWVPKDQVEAVRLTVERKLKKLEKEADTTAPARNKAFISAGS